MSVNKYTTAEGLVTLANGSRMWVGTKAAYDSAKQAGTLPTNVLIAITDDDEGLAQEVTKDDPRAVTSEAVYSALGGAKTYIRHIESGDSIYYKISGSANAILFSTGQDITVMNGYYISRISEQDIIKNKINPSATYAITTSLVSAYVDPIVLGKITNTSNVAADILIVVMSGAMDFA